MGSRLGRASRGPSEPHWARQSVSAVYLTARDTIDEMFNAVVEEKRLVVQAVLDGGSVDDHSGIIAELLQQMADKGQIPAGMADSLLGKDNKEE